MHYQLIDNNTGLAPRSIQTQRKNNNLEIKLDETHSGADIILQNYYPNGEQSQSSITGKFSDGSLYHYVPTNSSSTDAIPLLAENQLSTQVLGGKALHSATWSFSPWWLLTAIPLAGGIALSAKTKSTSQGEKGEKGDTGAQGEKGEKGDSGALIPTIPENPQTTLTIRTQNAGYRNMLNIDNIINENNMVVIRAFVESNVAKEGDVVRFTLPSGRIIGAILVELEDGSFSATTEAHPRHFTEGNSALTATINTLLPNGQTIVATATADILKDTVAPMVFIILNSISDDNAINAKESTSPVAITGKVYSDDANAGDTLNIAISGTNHTATLTETENSGEFNFRLEMNTSELTEGYHSIEASIQVNDEVGNTGYANAHTSFQKDTVAPNVVVNINSVAYDNVIDASESQGDVAVSGYIQNVQYNETVSHVTLILPNGEEIPVDAISSGWGTPSFSASVPASAFAEGKNTLQAAVFVQDSAGNVGTAETTTTVTKNTAEPIVDIVFAPISNDNILEHGESATISGTITVTNGTLNGSSIALDINGSVYSPSWYLDTTQGNQTIYHFEHNNYVWNSDNNITVFATVSDSFGNSIRHFASTSVVMKSMYEDDNQPEPMLEPAPNLDPNTTIIFDTIAEDDIINGEEIQYPVTISGKVISQSAQAGEPISISTIYETKTAILQAGENVGEFTFSTDLYISDGTITATYRTLSEHKEIEIDTQVGGRQPHFYVNKTLLRGEETPHLSGTIYPDGDNSTVIDSAYLKLQNGEHIPLFNNTLLTENKNFDLYSFQVNQNWFSEGQNELSLVVEYRDAAGNQNTHTQTKTILKDSSTITLNPISVQNMESETVIPVSGTLTSTTAQTGDTITVGIYAHNNLSDADSLIRSVETTLTATDTAGIFTFNTVLNASDFPQYHTPTDAYTKGYQYDVVKATYISIYNVTLESNRKQVEIDDVAPEISVNVINEDITHGMYGWLVGEGDLTIEGEINSDEAATIESATLTISNGKTIELTELLGNRLSNQTAFDFNHTLDNHLLDEGSNTLTLNVTAFDQAGNKTVSNTNFVILKDTIAPEVNISIEQYSLNVAINEEHLYEWQLDVDVNGNSQTHSSWQSLDLESLLKDGENTVTVSGTIYDEAGNSTPVHYTEIVNYHHGIDTY